MKKVTIAISQTLHVPDDWEIVDGPIGHFLKAGTVYLQPHVNWLHAQDPMSKEVRFVDTDEQTTDAVCAALTAEDLSMKYSTS